MADRSDSFPLMFNRTAKFYDMIYAFKDYQAEVVKIRDRLRAEHPGAKSILDVACGSGEHAAVGAQPKCDVRQGQRHR